MTWSLLCVLEEENLSGREKHAESAPELGVARAGVRCREGSRLVPGFRLVHLGRWCLLTETRKKLTVGR